MSPTRHRFEIVIPNASVTWRKKQTMVIRGNRGPKGRSKHAMQDTAKDTKGDASQDGTKDTKENAGKGAGSEGPRPARMGKKIAGMGAAEWFCMMREQRAKLTRKRKREVEPKPRMKQAMTAVSPSHRRSKRLKEQRERQKWD